MEQEVASIASLNCGDEIDDMVMIDGLDFVVGFDFFCPLFLLSPLLLVIFQIQILQDLDCYVGILDSQRPVSLQLDAWIKWLTEIRRSQRLRTFRSLSRMCDGHGITL